MASGLTSPASDELDRLRQEYDRLCDVMTRTAESDPLAAEQVLGELQALSQRMLALDAGPDPAQPAPVPNTDSRSDAPSPEPAPTPPAAAPASEPLSPAPPPAASPPEAARSAQQPSRIVAFRVTQASPAAAPDATVAGQTSWRLDAPPAPAEGAPGPEQPHTAAPPAAEPVPDDDAPPPATAPDAGGPGDAPGNAPGNAVVFSSAIRHWLERHRDDNDGAPAASPAARRPARSAVPATGAASESGGAAPAAPRQTEEAATMPPEAAEELSRLAAAVEQQALQIERILTLCTAHQEALEALQQQLAAPDVATPAAEDPRVAALGSAVEEQRQRVTALAKTIHNLAQWLAAQRGTSGL